MAPYPMPCTEFFINFSYYYQDMFIAQCTVNTQVILLIQLMHTYTLFSLCTDLNVACTPLKFCQVSHTT